MRVAEGVAMCHLYTHALAVAAASHAVASTPDYRGTLCPVDGGARVEVHADPSTTLMIIFPTPPGTGGWAMTQQSPGVYTHDIGSVSVGDSVSFSLLIQNPQQYTYPEHNVTLDTECTAFERDDVTPPPTRGFRHDILVRDGIPLLHFQAGAPGFGIPETTQVSATLRLDDGPFVTVPLIEETDGVWEVELPDAIAGQSVTYWFQQLIGIQTVYTALHERVIGDPATEPDWPLATRQSGRFHHRHPNEWRFDNYVEDYGEGRTFEIEVTDWGTRVDVTATIDPGLEVGQMDFKYFVENDPYSASCNRPLTVVNTKLTKNDNVFTGSIEDITPGAIIDFDFAFVDLPADNPVSIYYSDFYYYRAGSGSFGPETPNPRATPVGPATTPNVFSPRFGLAQHAPSLAHEDLKRFLAGKLFFETDWNTGDLLNVSTYFDCCAGPIGQPLDASPVHQTNLLGPRFNAASCIQCHALDGRGETPYEGVDQISLVAQLSIPGSGPHGEPIPHPLYGGQLSPGASNTATPEGQLRVQYTDVHGTFDDGTPWTLRKPTYEFHGMESGSLGTNLPDVDGSAGYAGQAEFSPRIAPILAGLGMLEAVSESEILSRVDEDDLDADGISGRANYVWDQAAAETRLGRFGWKANQPSLRQQAAGAYLADMGLTSSLYPMEDCGDEQIDCDEGNGPEVSADELDDIAGYLQGLTLPPRRNFEDEEAIAGMYLFKQASCHACHTPTLRTGPAHEVAAYRNMDIEPFTDLLLHDMGPDLADNRPHFEASGSEWRTPPLWALSYVGQVLGVPETCEDPESGGAEPNFLHDGRARSIMEAILWHGGEAEASRDAVLAMNQAQRDQLVAYTTYPFADPIFDDIGQPTCVGDITIDGVVDLNDLLLMLTHWGDPGSADLDGDGAVDTDDIAQLIANWGPC